MLTHTKELGFRLGQFAHTPLANTEIAAIMQTLGHYYGQQEDYCRLLPQDNHQEIRTALTQAAPALAQMASQMRKMLEGDYSALLLPQFGLAQLDVNTRGFVLFALSLCIGFPSATNKIDKKIVWDVKANAARMQSGDVTTFSEHAYEATLHTDTQYYPFPERYVLLYFIQPAACGGGISQLRDARCIKHHLQQSREGRWALDFLSNTPLPFRIPGTFTTTGHKDTVEITVGKIFEKRPTIRFRIDTLEKGLLARPEYDTEDVRDAIAILQAELAKPELMYQSHLPADSMLLVNNHEVLHGRSDFADYERHAIRIRIADHQHATELAAAMAI